MLGRHLLIGLVLRATGGRVSCWGIGAHGQLGRGAVGNANVPVDVVGPEGAVSIAAGYAHACAAREDGRVFCWGGNSTAQLGDGRPWWPSPTAVAWPHP